MYKVIVSQKKESTLNHWNESFLKRIPSIFMLKSTWNISILPAHLLVFSSWSRSLNENANSFFATRCCFWSLKNSCFPDNAVHRTALPSQTLLHQALQAYYMLSYNITQVFFDLACMSTCCWGLPKSKYEPFITHNRGTLTKIVKILTFSVSWIGKLIKYCTSVCRAIKTAHRYIHVSSTRGTRYLIILMKKAHAGQSTWFFFFIKQQCNFF